MEDGLLTWREEILGPAVVDGRRQPAVQVDDRLTGERERVCVERATAQSCDALNRDAGGVGRLRGNRDGDGEAAFQLVLPPDPDRLTPLRPARRARNLA